ncbi:MAG TPA: SAM-dependent methyltransferase [Bacteroidaceae bacterium]|nr:SAM-dependent methyltransferase [Bacteroidaceae bacterium]
MESALYLIPVPLGETPIDQVLPAYNREVILEIRHFIVEDIRSARRFLKKCERAIDIDELTFYELNKHTNFDDISSFLKPLRTGHPMGVISEAGCPGVADPGADVVAIAQRERLKVVPLVGPSSILMSLMASGFNGQRFAFHGYLPIQSPEREQYLKKLEQGIYTDDETQIFIETPYRNDKMLDTLIKQCKPDTKLCVACHISCEDEMIQTQKISSWKKSQFTIGKRPCIFLLYK